MLPRYIVTAAEWQIRVHELNSAFGHTIPTLREVESLEYARAHEPYAARGTDRGGRFPGNGPQPGSSGDERLSAQTEEHLRVVAWIVERIESFITRHPAEGWVLAAGPALHNRIVEGLTSDTRASLVESVDKNLIHAPAQELPGHFLLHTKGRGAQAASG